MNENEVSSIITTLRVAVDDLAETKYQIKMAEFRAANAHCRFENALQDVKNALLAAAPTAKGVNE